MAAYELNEHLAEIAAQVIAEHENLARLADAGCRIAYQTSTLEKKTAKKMIYADTEKVKEKYKGVLPYDFLITFYWPNCERLSEEGMKRLMFHELCHVGFSGDGKCFIVPHDIEDFRECIENWGVDWIAQS